MWRHTSTFGLRVSHGYRPAGPTENSGPDVPDVAGTHTSGCRRPKDDAPKATEPNLRLPERSSARHLQCFCDNLRSFCSFLAPLSRNLHATFQEKQWANMQKSAVLCENLRFGLISLSVDLMETLSDRKRARSTSPPPQLLGMLTSKLLENCFVCQWPGPHYIEFMFR